ncbi:MAG: hypothetical protein ABH811_02055 [archaeon]
MIREDYKCEPNCKSKSGDIYWDRHPKCVHDCELAKKNYYIFENCIERKCLKEKEE